MINIHKLTSAFADDIAISVQACRDIFWDVADLAGHVRSQFRHRRTLSELADREQGLYEQLGHEGYVLLVDGISVERTPQVDATLKEIRHYQTLRQQHARGMFGSSWDVRASMSARRLAHIVRSGEWQIHALAVTAGSPWIGRELTGETPTGICLAVRRDQSLHPFISDWRFLDGDLLMVLAPPTYFPEWTQWVTEGSTDSPGTQ